MRSIGQKSGFQQGDYSLVEILRCSQTILLKVEFNEPSIRGLKCHRSTEEEELTLVRRPRKNFMKKVEWEKTIEGKTRVN